ncbi:hypothetical protein K227x_31940 [Rubripirellula lacrimiformis]|uniref:Tll0287-like domain-containing protein n=1 Tax=Rubripirellula lacrimiformis TaxID=1930273 RepID=A0A517NCE0_9BACT|nr:DUF3365 domain-containing protein [Rubripirellula lacrimiformis]QDT04797.1 hypothetical protein K227x_31940 [Rubripirellula lacrimiformis]
MKRTVIRSPLPLACVLTTIALMGCGQKDISVSEPNTQDTADTTAVVAGELPSEEDQQSMLAAKDALFQKLSGRLMQAMGQQGPAAAIQVCQKEASQMAAEVGQATGMRIGRTGVRLRNPQNQPPAWAKPLTEQRIDTATFVKLDNGDSAALLPIKLQSQCLMCHGPEDQIAPIISDQLAKLYPADKATGFREGELRGWFWVQMPSS